MRTPHDRPLSFDRTSHPQSELHFVFGNVFPLSTLPVDSSKRSAFLLPVAELPVTLWPEPPTATP